MEPIAKLNSYINSAIPYAWDDSESWFEFLAKVLKKVNELIDASNDYFAVDLVTYTENLLAEWVANGRMTTLLNALIAHKANQTAMLEGDAAGIAYTDAKNTILQEMLTQTLTQQYAALNTKIDGVASGSPKDVFSTVAALSADTAANTPEGKQFIYVVNEDGNWYYWGGSAWVAGGVYLSVGVSSEVEGIIYRESVNRYNPALQTPLTIDSKYYVSGFPYWETTYDGAYDCTALFSIEPNTEYTIGFVPTIPGQELPWGGSTNGIFFYDSLGNYISSAYSATFTTPSATAKARFNIYVESGLTLDIVNHQLMLVKGTALPDEYKSYHDTIGEVVDKVESMVVAPICYSISNDEITLVAKHGADKDLAVTLKKSHGNNLFEFYRFDFFPNTYRFPVLREKSPATEASIANGDWHAPFMVGALSNIDGDQPQTYHFTGGNHQYNNTAIGSTATARTSTYEFFVNGRKTTSGTGYANSVEMRWTNLVQGHNTTKVDGSGREILQENHRIIFDGLEFKETVDIIPLEDVDMKIWYGFQTITATYEFGKVRYIGGLNKGEYDSNIQSSCGDNKATKLMVYDGPYRVEVEIEGSYDLGRREFYSGPLGAFTEPYGKSYFFIIKDTTLVAGGIYSLRGSYKFLPE